MKTNCDRSASLKKISIAASSRRKTGYIGKGWQRKMPNAKLVSTRKRKSGWSAFTLTKKAQKPAFNRKRLCV